MREQFTVVVLPHWCAPVTKDVPFHVSFFVSPDIEADGPGDTLATSRLFRHWTRALGNAEFVLEDQTGRLTCRAQCAAIEQGLWEEIFPQETPVQSHVPPNWTGRPWRTFHAGATTAIARLVNLRAVLADPVEAPTVQKLPWLGEGIFELLKKGWSENFGEARINFQPLDLVAALERELTEELDEVIRDGVPLDSTPTPKSYFTHKLWSAEADAFRRLTALEEMGVPVKLLVELHRARRFYSRPEEQSEYQERPSPDGSDRRAPEKLIPDFHARVSLINDHGSLQRKLGLVIDVESDPVRLAQSEWLLGRILIPRWEGACKVVRVATRRVGKALVTRARDEGQWINGRLPIGDPQAFDLLDLDPDGAALKTEQYLFGYPRSAAAAVEGAPVNAASPTLRTSGFTVARKDNAATTAEAMGHQRQFLEEVRNQPPKPPAASAPLLHTEDVMQGVRVEVHDDRTGRWRSLHEVNVTAEVAGGRSLEFEDVAFLQETVPTHADGDDTPIHVHEAVFGWDGWSLSAPRPALPVVNEDGKELVVTDPRPPVDPSTPLQIQMKARSGSLPRLRFGRRYSFRAWGVDLACNSRPHPMAPSIAVGPGAPASPPAMAATIDRATLQRFRAAALPLMRQGPIEDESPALPIETLTREAGMPLAELMPHILGRMQQRLGDFAERPSSELDEVRRAFAAGLNIDDLAPAATAVLNPAVVQAGLALDPDLLTGPIAAQEAKTVTPELPFLRWQPVPPPAIVPRRVYTEGESTEVLVIRSRVSQDPRSLQVTVGTPEGYAEEVEGRRASCERHLVPPKTSQMEAEQHGAFDGAIASMQPEIRNRWLHAAIRESGTLFDLDVPRLDDPATRDPQIGIALVHGPGASPGELKTLTPGELNTLLPGEAPAPGQYVIHDTDLLRTPYLPDVLARGLGFVFPDAGREWTVLPPFGVEGFTARYRGTWPEIDGYRLVLDGGSELNGRVEQHLVTISLPPGTMLLSRVASSLTPDDLEVMGVWRQLPEEIQQLPAVSRAAANGWLWALTPPSPLRMVHAVPRPVRAPEPIRFTVVRHVDDTKAWFWCGVQLHGQSTDSLSVEARWDEVLDDLVRPEGHRLEHRRQVAAMTKIEPWEDIAVLAGAFPDRTVDLETGRVRAHRALQEFGDTRHRLVHYRLRATTRFREYFPPDELAPLPQPDDSVLPVDDGCSTVSAEIEVHVPNTSLPAPPMVHSVIPLFLWDDGPEPDQPMAKRRTRRAGVRVYLERPWFTTGADEQIGVVLAKLDVQRPEKTFTSQWGGDQFWVGSHVADRELVQVTDLLGAIGLDAYETIGGPSGQPVQLPSAEDPEMEVWVIPYRPQYNETRRNWFVDIRFVGRFWPFVQLSLVRYQPYSLAGRHISKPVRCDYVQIPPERTASVSRTSEGRVRVLVSGPVGYHDVPLGHHAHMAAMAAHRNNPLEQILAAVASNRMLRAKLQKRQPGASSDLAWETVEQTDLNVRGYPDSFALAPSLVWTGELDVPESLLFGRPRAPDPKQPGAYRVRIEEWETFEGEREDLGDPESEPTKEKRLIYADEFELGSEA